TLPSSVLRIKSCAFYGCSKLSVVSVPIGVTSIGDGAFAQSGLTSVTVPDSVTSIGSGAFRACGSLESAKLSGGIDLIESHTFYECRSLKSVEIPSGVTYIGNNAFNYCESLTSVKFGGTTGEWKTVDKSLFWNSNTAEYTVTCSDGTVGK
ncbi:MAG: leucine-rich repeat domain-containing protein, partial [Clostridiales bacterium]|nr:leucine-rich repeat domain-containing protein [Clostridiales bacterium]